MNRQYALVQFQHNELAMPAHGFYKLIADAPPQCGELLAHYVMRGELGIQNAPPGELGRQSPNYRFNFG